MGPWGFVALAYGVVWGAITIYAYCLTRRYRAAAAELAHLDATEPSPTKENV